MSILGINSDMLGQTVAFTTVHPFNFVFPLLFPKILFFPAAHQTCLRKMTISDSFIVGSS